LRKKFLTAEIGIELATSVMTIWEAASLTDKWSKAVRKIQKDGQSHNAQDNSEPNGQYANYFTVGHNAFEFLFDFGQIHTDGKPPPLHTRIITTPVHAKTLLRLLQESVEQYEQLFGSIPDGDQ
jgi:Protein of unknown function (DUF3467)